jgi:hypothetical protein
MSGHLYVVHGDIQQIAVDAWMIPVDHNLSFTSTWERTLSHLDPRVNLSRWETNPVERVRLLQNLGGCDIWIGDVGRYGETAAHYADVACHFIARSAEECHRRVTHRRPIVAINHLGTGHGGAKDRHGNVLRTLIGAIHALLADDEHGVDVVLVSWGHKPYAAAQRARRILDADWRTSHRWAFDHEQERKHSKAEELAGYLVNTSMAVFLGAGMSAGAGLLGWNDLLDAVGSSLEPPVTGTDLESFSDPRDRAAFLERRLARSGRTLGGELVGRLRASRYSLQHGLIASLPGDEFITTNVDDLFEKACKQAGRPLTVMPHTSTESSRWLLKLHGSVERPESLIFTRDHYSASIRNSRALLGLVQAMLFTRHMFFVGYGLRDEDFHELVYEVKTAFPDGTPNRRLGTVMALFADAPQEELWGEFLDIVPMRPREDRRNDAASAVRDLERFLDLVGMLANHRADFLLDDHYEGMLEAEERALRDVLVEVQGHISGHEGPTWQPLRDFLRRFGA